MAKEKIIRPTEVVLFETELGIKFKGPYSDGREWDAVLNAKTEIDCMKKIGELAIWLEKNGFTKDSDNVNATFAIKLNKNVNLAIGRCLKGLQITLYYDD